MADNSAENVLLDLKKSFLDDKRDLQDKIIEVETEIRQCNDFIESLNKKDECDFNMFSPRSASRVYKDQVYEKKLEIEELEEKLRVYYKKLAGITKKIDSLNSLNPDDIEIEEEKKTEEISVDFDNVESSVFLKLQEEDRQRIASDLHDSVLQNLSLVMHNLELAEKFIDYDAVRAKLELESNRRIIKETIEEIRSTIFDLRPMQFDDFGFKRTMENHLESYKSRTSMEITYHIDDVNDKDNLVLLTIFRVVQELVINSIKHSKGSVVNVQILDEGSGIYVEVSDNGIGMSDEDFNKNNHFGMKILLERVKLIGGNIHKVDVEHGTKFVVEFH